MPTLLQLPVELRLQIYALAISSRPHVINTDEGATSKDPPRSSTARSLADVDEQLSHEMMPLYWSTNVFEAYLLSGMGHYIPTDRTFHRWLKDIVKDAVIYVRHLRFKGLPKVHVSQAHEAECIMTVNVDLKLRTIAMWSKTGRRSSCDHAEELASRMNIMLGRIPVVHGQLQPTLPALWDIFDCWHGYRPVIPTPRRPWDEFQRQYDHHGP